jgi:hypothetical protein
MHALCHWKKILQLFIYYLCSQLLVRRALLAGSLDRAHMCKLPLQYSPHRKTKKPDYPVNTPILMGFLEFALCKNFRHHPLKLMPDSHGDLSRISHEAL